MTTLTQEPATDGQIKQLTRMATDAVEKAVKVYLDENFITKAQAERVKGNPAFAERIRAETLNSLSELSTSDKYKDEEVESNYGYLSGYEKPNPEEVQVSRLKELCPELGNNPTVGQWRGDVPKGAEGLFCVINVWKPSSVLPGIYNDQVQWMLDKIKSDRNGKFHNYRDGQIGPDRLRQTARSKAVFEKHSEQQGHPDILVIAAQFGLEHRGLSVRWGREVMMDQNQFGLGAYVTGIMLLTHPDRLKHYEDLCIDCAGDEYDDPGAGDRFDRAPDFRFGDGGVRFDASWTGLADGRYGSASGFLSQ